MEACSLMNNKKIFNGDEMKKKLDFSEFLFIKRR